MKALDSFTVERLEKISNSAFYYAGAEMEEIQALARIALAAKRAEPIYQYQSGVCNDQFDGIEWVWDDCDKGFYEQYDPTRRRIVYTTPRLNSPEVSDGWKLVPIEPNWEMLSADGCKEHHKGETCLHHDNRKRIWQAMLAAAPEPQNQQQNIPENIPQGWIKCSDQMPEDDTLCLGVDEDGVIWTMYFDGEFRADTGWPPDLNVTHWMPLPDSPEKPL